jgi:hypothetical protein
MKKLVFNGCSFMAGDELVWEKYQKERGKEFQPWHQKQTNYDDSLFRLEYRKYRKQFNLPSVVSRKLGCEWDDLSADGTSNTNIVINTIAYLNDYSKEERQKCHVIIGWTCISRILKYSPTQKIFLNLTAQHYSEHTEDPAKTELKEHIKTQILGADDQDFILDYIRNVMLLENYLISNNITHTFYRALDDGLYKFKNIGPFDYDSTITLNIEDCTNHNNWYPFSGAPIAPINEYGWNRVFFNKPNLVISQKNGHPSLFAINAFSTKLSEFVQKQNVL